MINILKNKIIILIIISIVVSGISVYADQRVTVFRVSDATSPGEIFTLYGENLFRESVKVKIINISDANVPETPPADAFSADVVNGDREGHFVALMLPKNALPGVYAVWAGNDKGYAMPVILNAVRPQWLSQKAAAAGQKVRIIGRNQDGREFGTQALTAVRLCYNEQKINADVITVNPFAVEFYMPNEVIPDRTYQVEITNDGVIWKTPEWKNSIIAKAPFNDVFNLGVWWASDYNTANVYDVTKSSLKAIPNDGVDDAAAIQKNINEAYAAGGGIVYLPQGEYRFNTTLWLYNGVILQGEGMGKTTLTCTYTGSGAGYMGGFIRSHATYGSAGKMGITGVKIQLDESLPYIIPDAVINISTDSKYFVTESEIKMPFAWQEANNKRGIAMLCGINSDVLIRGNKISGCQGMYYGSKSNYTTVRDNEFSTMAGHISLIGIYNIAENNNVTIRHDIPELENVTFSTLSEGAIIRGPAYVAGNVITGTGRTDRNDGEVMMSESAGANTKMYGVVASAAENSVTVNPINVYDWNIENPKWNKWTICIIDGKGMGQYREISSMNMETNTITVAVPWNIIPDTTSKFNVILPSVGNTFYNNRAYNAAKGYWFYNDTIDGVIYGNSGTNTEGAFVNTYTVKNEDDQRLTISYYDRLESNSFYGVSTRSNVCGAGSRISIETSDGLAYAYQQYGFEIKNNTIIGAEGELAGGTEAPDINGIYVVNFNSKQPSNRYAAKSIVIEDNMIANTDRGITIGGGGYPLNPGDAYSKAAPAITGVCVKGNRFSNVISPYNVTISNDDISYIEGNGIYDNSYGTLYKENSAGIYEKADKVTVGKFKYMANVGVIASETKSVSLVTALYSKNQLVRIYIDTKILTPGIKQLYSSEFQYTQDEYDNNIYAKFFILEDFTTPIFN